MDPSAARVRHPIWVADAGGHEGAQVIADRIGVPDGGA